MKKAGPQPTTTPITPTVTNAADADNVDAGQQQQRCETTHETLEKRVVAREFLVNPVPRCVVVASLHRLRSLYRRIGGSLDR